MHGLELHLRPIQPLQGKSKIQLVLTILMSPVMFCLFLSIPLLSLFFSSVCGFGDRACCETKKRKKKKKKMDKKKKKN